MIPILIALFQDGSSFAEHGKDLYPIIGWIVVSLLTIIGAGIALLIRMLAVRLNEFKKAQDELLKAINDHILSTEKRFGHNELRLTLLEREVGVTVPQSES